MKTIRMLCFAMLAFTACNSDKSNSNENASGKPGSAAVSPSPSTAREKDGSSVHEMLAAYLQIKNSLANDNAPEAAAGGNEFVKAMEKMNRSVMTASQQKQFSELADDATEMAEHIGKSAGKMASQREHFDMLSKDVYDMTKIFKPAGTLYKDYCPMYNKGKGAIWLSETKEIRNPYFGKEMPACGEVKEEIK